MKGSLRRGFTLLEVIIAATILTIVLGVVITLLITTGNFFNTASLDTDVQGRAQKAMETVTKELSGVYRNTIKFNTTTNVNYATLTYKVTVGWDTAGNVPDYGSPVQWRTIVWHKDPAKRKLTFALTGAVPIEVTRDVLFFDFKNVNTANDTKQVIYLTLSKSFQAPNLEWRTHAMKQDIYLLNEPN